MPIRPLRADDLPALLSIYNALVAPLPHALPATPEEFGSALTGVPANLRGGAVLVAESDGRPVAFARAGRNVPVANRWTLAAPDQGMLFGPFVSPEHLTEGVALIRACEEWLRRQGADLRFAFDPGEATGAPFYNAGFSLLSERLAHIVHLLAQDGFRVRHREMCLTRPALGPPVPAPLPAGLLLRFEDEGANRYAAYAMEGTRRVGDCHHSLVFPQRGRNPDGLGLGYIDGLGLDEPYQGRGLGRLLLRHALARLYTLGAGPVLLTTGSENYRAQNLYFSEGFALVDTTVALARADVRRPA